MSRTEDLKKIFKDVDEGKRVIVDRLIEEAVFLEEQLTELKKYPRIKFHPKNPNLQKVTATGKLYREYLQTYTNIIRALERTLVGEETESDSPLRAFIKELKNQ